MTIKITPEAVKERIAALESAGEISLKEQFYLEYMRESLDKDRRIEQLTAERDALREEGIGTNTKAAADIYFQLVEELDIPSGGSLVQCIYDMRERLDAMDSEPVFNLLVSQAGYNGQKLGNNFGFTTLDAARELKEGKYQLYRHAQPAPKLKPVGYLFVSDQGAIAYSPTNWGMPGFKLAGQIFGDIDVKAQPAPVVPDGIERFATTLEYIGNFADAAIIRQLAANQQQNAPQNIPEIIPDSCTWTFSNYDDHWSGTCGAEWVFNDGGPEENGVKFCPKCGKSVAISATE